jgi:hypothetical protein
MSGKVAGAALDVFHDEKKERGKKLLELSQVIGSPHVGLGPFARSAKGMQFRQRCAPPKLPLTRPGVAESCLIWPRS